MKEYDITFYTETGETIRRYRLINIASFRARSLMKQFYNLDGATVALNADFLSQMNDKEDVLNELMGKILIGDHAGVCWFDAEAQSIDEVLRDFFTSYAERIRQSLPKQDG